MPIIVFRVFVSAVRSPRRRSGGSAAAPPRERQYRRHAEGRPAGSGCSSRASIRRPGATPRCRSGAGSAPRRPPGGHIPRGSDCRLLPCVAPGGILPRSRGNVPCVSARSPRSSAGVRPWVSLPPWRGDVGGGTNKRKRFRAACSVGRKRRPVPRIRGEPGERRMVRDATLGSRPDGAAPQGEVVRSGSQKTDTGFLCHENTTSLPSVFEPGNRQHIRRQQSNCAESRGRKGFSAEALPYRQTAGGSCRGKEGERAAFSPNGSEHVVVQPRAAGNRWKVVGSSVGSRGGDEWRCHGR